jgi:hypothetical protein
MKTYRYLLPFLSIVAILALAGCADTEMRKEDWAAVSKSGVKDIYQKMRDHDVLTLSDIEELSNHHVSSDIIVRYLRSTGAVYVVKGKQIHRLRKNGVSDEVIDYLVSTSWHTYPSGPYPYASYPSQPHYPYGLDPVNDPMYGSFYLIDSPVFFHHFHHHHHGEHHGGGHHH